MIQTLKKAIRLIIERFREQGAWTTLVWFYGRGLPLITGIPIMKYCQITPQIFVGAQYGPAGKRKLERLGIEADINMRSEFDDAAHGLALQAYCYLPTVDDTAPTLDHLHQGVEFIEQIVATGGKVYIHCAGGIGRAPTMAVAYFISRGHTLGEAVTLVKKSRPFIKIMPPQMAQLKRFETLQRKNSPAATPPRTGDDDDA